MICATSIKVNFAVKFEILRDVFAAAIGVAALLILKKKKSSVLSQPIEQTVEV